MAAIVGAGKAAVETKMGLACKTERVQQVQGRDTRPKVQGRGPCGSQGEEPHLIPQPDFLRRKLFFPIR